MKPSTTLLVFILLVSCAAFWASLSFTSPYVPLFIWSGSSYSHTTVQHKQLDCQNKLSTHSIVADYYADMEKTTAPKAFLTFVYKNLKTSDLLKYSGTVGQKQSNVFRNLKHYTESSSSLILPNCKTTYKPMENNIIINNPSDFETILSSLDWTTSTNKITVLFEDHKQSTVQLSLFDDWMNQITRKVASLTGDNYVASVTSVLDSSVSFEMKNDNTNDTPIVNPGIGYDNFTRTNLYMDETVAGGMLVSILIFLIAYVGFYRLMGNVVGGPNIASFEGEEEMAKKRK